MRKREFKVDNTIFLSAGETSTRWVSVLEAVEPPDSTYCILLHVLVVTADKFQFSVVRTVGVDPAQ